MLNRAIVVTVVLMVVAWSLHGNAAKESANTWDNALDGPWYVTEFFYGYPREVCRGAFFFHSGTLFCAFLDDDRIDVLEYDVTIEQHEGDRKFVSLRPFGEDKLYHGIYQLQGNQLTMAFGEERPATFDRIVDRKWTTSSANPRIFALKRGKSPGASYGKARGERNK